MTPEKLDELELLFDKGGIPHIWAADLHDLLAAARREAALREAFVALREKVDDFDGDCECSGTWTHIEVRQVLALIDAALS